MKRRIIKAKWYCAYNPCKRGYDLYLSAILEEDSMRIGALPDFYYVKEIEFVEQDFSCDHPPLLTLEEDQAQELMDALWKGGLRPTKGRGSVGQLDAVKEHLDDMRKIVFGSFLPEISELLQLGD